MDIARQLPRLLEHGFTETSPATTKYNCIAWAAGVTDDWWWPDPMGQYYWPDSVPRVESLDAFEAAFATVGYLRTEHGELEIGMEKIAIFVVQGRPKHAARQLADGKWTSKLGRWVDITHEINGIEGTIYGSIACFLKRPIK